ncbi:MAG: hypothetical protein LDL41_08820 [Coleofasciculus sp. S288]|nr:hypothetical protein [Coleofasciculus sp. S288]
MRQVSQFPITNLQSLCRAIARFQETRSPFFLPFKYISTILNSLSAVPESIANWRLGVVEDGLETRAEVAAWQVHH